MMVQFLVLRGDMAWDSRDVEVPVDTLDRWALIEWARENLMGKSGYETAVEFAGAYLSVKDRCRLGGK